MLAKTYQDMLGAKSVIREIFAYGTSRAEEIGKENVFDYSLGNPSVPAPQAFTDEMIRLLMEEEPVALHGYSPSLGIDSVRKGLGFPMRKSIFLWPAERLRHWHMPFGR